MMPKLNFADIARLSEVIGVFSDEGFHFILKNTPLIKHLPLRKKFRRGKKDNLPARLRRSFEKLGPTFIKFGQMLSLRPDLIPSEFAEEFKKLQNQVEPFPSYQARKIVEKELKKPISEVFKSFSEKPVAAASLAQVHTARLKSNNKKVAIKIQRPGISDIIKEDLEIMYFIAKILETKKEFKRYRPVEAVNTFKEMTENELDFKTEASNYEKFARNFVKDPKVTFPKVYWNYSTKKIIVMDFVDGKKLNQIKTDPKVYITKIVEVFLQMVFRDGFFHADMHPGNILVKDDKVAFLDVGMVGYLSSDLRSVLELWFLFLLQRNYSKMIDVMLKVCTLYSDSNVSKFKKESITLFSESYNSVLSHYDFRKNLLTFIDLSVKNRIIPPPEIILFVRGFSIVEGVALELCPNMDLELDILPIVKRIFRKTTAKNLFSKSKIASLDFANLLTELPTTSRNILRKIELDGFDIKLEHREFQVFETILDRAGSTMAFGFIIAGLVMAGSLTLDVKYNDTNIISSIFFGLAIILLLIIFIRILSVRKLLRENDEVVK